MTAEGAPAARLAQRVAVAATGLAVTTLFTTAAASGAAGAGAPEAAYWWQPEPVSGLIPVPGVPSDGLYVASSSTGPQAESAVRFDVPSPTAYVQLTLHVSMQERVGKPTVIAYPTTSHWQTGGPQPWSARPSYRASARPSRGVFTHGGTTMTLTFPAHEAAAGVVLVPDPKAANQNFTIAFAPPRSADISFRSTPSRSPSASASAGPPSHRPTGTPTGRHTGRPSSRPSHHSHSPKPSKSPGRSATPSPSGSATGSPSTAPSAASASGHGARNVLIGTVSVLAVLLVLFWVFRTGTGRRSPPDGG